MQKLERNRVLRTAPSANHLRARLVARNQFFLRSATKPNQRSGRNRRICWTSPSKDRQRHHSQESTLASASGGQALLRKSRFFARWKQVIFPMNGRDLKVSIGSASTFDLNASNPTRSTGSAVSTIAPIFCLLAKRVNAAASQCSAYLQIAAADSQSQKQSEMKSKLRRTIVSRKPLQRITQDASRSKSDSVKVENSRESLVSEFTGISLVDDISLGRLVYLECAMFFNFHAEARSVENSRLIWKNCP